MNQESSGQQTDHVGPHPAGQHGSTQDPPISGSGVMVTMRGYGLSSWSQGSIVALTCHPRGPLLLQYPSGRVTSPHCTAQALRVGVSGERCPVHQASGLEA